MPVDVVVIVPYVTSQITDDSVYGLYIWKESGWQLLEEREGDKCGVLFFENVPGNGLFRLDRHMGMVRNILAGFLFIKMEKCC